MNKECRRCKLTKDIEGFSIDTRMSDGRLNTCRVCRTQEIKDKKENLKITGATKVITEKRCKKCTRIKPIEEFYKSIGCLDGHKGKCKVCCDKEVSEHRKANRPEYNAYMRGFNALKTPYERYLTEILRRYGCTKEMYERMLIDQDYKCALCQTPHNDKKHKGRLFVDHCHDSKQIRGLLCHSCNCMLGYSKDNVRVLLASVPYINRHKKAA